MSINQERSASSLFAFSGSLFCWVIGNNVTSEHIVTLRQPSLMNNSNALWMQDSFMTYFQNSGRASISSHAWGGQKIKPPCAYMTTEDIYGQLENNSSCTGAASLKNVDC